MLTRLLCLLSAGLLMAQTAADPAAIARKALDHLLAQQYSGLTPMFTPDARKAFPETGLAKLGVQIKSWGAVETIGDASVRRTPVNTVVSIAVRFATQNISFQFGVNPAGQIAQMFYVPGEVNWKRPAYSKPESFHEREVTVGDDSWKLPGTVTLPAGSGPFPGIVLVHGSGANDRDETIGASKVFKDLAEGLASNGIAVLRYEKRTRQYASRTGGMSLTVEQETVEDAVRAAAVLRAQPEVNPKRVFVLGHALGGYLAPRVAQEDGKLAGIAILAGNARPLEDLVVEQSIQAGLPAQQVEAIKGQAARVKALDAADVDAPRLLGFSAPYWLDLKGYDPVAQAKALAIPVLILQGERDFQTSMKDFAVWKSALSGRKDVTLRSYPELNHVFVAGEGKSTEAEYRKPGHVAPDVVDAVVKWLKQ